MKIVVFMLLAVFAILTSCGEKKPELAIPVESTAPKTEESEPVKQVVEKFTSYKRFQVKPVNDILLDKELDKTVGQLTLVVSKKDKAGLLELISKSIKIDDAIPAADVDNTVNFTKKWKLDIEPGKSEIWTILDNIIKSGFKKISNEKFGAPYYCFFDYPADIDKQTAGFIIGNNVNIREKPTKDSIVVKQLSNEIVLEKPVSEKVFDTINGEKFQWHRVVMYNGYSGYVFGKFYNPIDTNRIVLEKKDNIWKITELY